MKIVSWNVNGLRALVKKGQFDWLVNQDFDIFCLQETKSYPEQLDESVRNPAGYFSYFDHSKMRKGYSGVAIYSKVKPEKVEYGFGVGEFDQEGRLLVAYYKDFVLLNCYFPNGGGGEVRLAYKLAFYDHFLNFIEKLRKSGKKIIFCGDVNTAHEEIDLARPKENEKNTGFLPVERKWIDKVIKKGYVDILRDMNPLKREAYTYWDMKTFARERNVGWRIDYFFVSGEIKDKIISTKILDNIFGSDHCPILLEIKF